MIPPCPHCSSRSGVERNCRAYGWVVQWFDESGRMLESDHDTVYTTPSKTLRCPDCYKIRRDVVMAGITVKKRGE